MYRRLRDFDAAVEDLLKALDMMMRHQEGMVQQAQRQLLLAYNDFAVHCYMQGAYQESVLLLNKALKGEQQEKGLYVNRGGEQGLAGPEPLPLQGLGGALEARREEGREEGKKHLRVSVTQGHTWGSFAFDKLATVCLRTAQKAGTEPRTGVTSHQFQAPPSGGWSRLSWAPGHWVHSAPSAGCGPQTASSSWAT